LTWTHEEFEDTKGVTRIRKWKKNRQHNDQKKKDKQRSTKHTHKTKDRVTRALLKTDDESWMRKLYLKYMFYLNIHCIPLYFICGE